MRRKKWNDSLAQCGKDATCDCKAYKGVLYGGERPSRRMSIRLPPTAGRKSTFKAYTYCMRRTCKCPKGKNSYKMGGRCYPPRPAGMRWKRPDQKMKSECLQDASCAKNFANANAIYKKGLMKNINRYDKWYQNTIEDIAKIQKKLKSSAISNIKKKYMRARIGSLRRSQKWNRQAKKYYERNLKKDLKKMNKPSRRYGGMTRPQGKVLSAWSGKKRRQIRKIWYSQAIKANCNCLKSRTYPQCTNYGKVLLNTCRCPNAGPTARPTAPEPTSRPTPMK